MNNKKGLFFIISCIILYILCIKPVYIFAEETQERKLIRVGYPIQKGFTEIKENGEYKGYTYDYLMEIAQYTNWKYEFVQAEGDMNTQLTTLLNMLIEGKIDLMGGMVYNDSLAQLMDYSGDSYGISSSAFFALKKNTKINSFNYFTFDNLKIAVQKNAKNHNAKLNQFMEMNGLKLEKVFCESYEEQIKAVEKGKADIFLGMDVNIPSPDFKVIAKFSPQPFYFGISKGKQDIVKEINFALNRINESNPYFMTALYEEYFGVKTQEFYLSKEEKNYIEQKNIIKVGMMGGTAPIQYKDKKTGIVKGVSKNVLDYIEEQTGLKFEIIWANSLEEYLELIKEKKVDLISGIPNGYQKNTNQDYYTISIPYIYSPTAIALNKKIDPSQLKGKRLALPRTNIDVEEEKVEEAVYFDTMEQCLEELHKGNVDYCYGNSYSIQYYFNSQRYKNIVTMPQSENWSQKICFGIIKSDNVNLASIINKAIQNIPEEELKNFLYANAFQSEDITLISYIRSNPRQVIFVSLLLFLVFIIIFLFLSIYNYRKNNEKIKLESQRYEQISELSNEFIYEYNIRKDTLKVSEKCANFLGCEKIIKYLSLEAFNLINRKYTGKQELFGYIISAKEGNKELICTLPDGTHWIKVISKIILNANNIPIYLIGKIVDIQQEKEKQNKLLEKSQRDSLTKLYNAATSRQIVTEILNSLEKEKKGAFLIMDIDYFKSVNDNFGHYTGDFVLEEVANILKTIFRKNDIIGRLGGDEFIIFMKDITDKTIIIEKCEALRKKIKEIIIAEQKNLISVSIGVTLAKEGKSYNELYKTADKALYIVKNRGRDGFEIIEE